LEKYLLTGFSGFVSKHFLNYLEMKGEQATILGIDMHAPAFKTSGFKHLACEFEKLDLLDKDRVQNVIDKFRPQYILHLASYSSVSFSWNNPILSFQNNTNIFLNILEAVRLLDSKPKILSVGSSEEYGNTSEDSNPLHEEHLLNPVSPYAVARVSQELLSNVYVHGYGLDIVLTRSFNHIGPGQSDVFVVSSFAKQLVEGWRENKKKVTIETGDLRIVRDFLDVRDVVRAYYILLRKGRSGEVFNVCSGRGISLFELLQMMAKALQVDCVPILDTRLVRPKENMAVIGSNQKIRRETGWSQEIQLEKAIEDILADWKERLPSEPVNT
jgi:GDP-4-dehydro-6-deoxy-D-mannose reductase